MSTFLTHHSRLSDIDPLTAYRIMALRVGVFVHEQRIVDEVEMDGKDLDPGTEIYWVSDPASGDVVATLRVLSEPDGTHIGRVATAASARGQGLASRLITAAIAATAQTVVVSAQAHLEDWYGGFGFRRRGANYLDAGIPHVTMVREVSPGEPSD